MRHVWRLWIVATAAVATLQPAYGARGTKPPKVRYGGDASGAEDLKTLGVRLNLGVRYAVNAPKNTPFNRPIMAAVKARDERFQACYSRMLENYPARKVTALAFRAKLDGARGRFTLLSRQPGSKGNEALARCVGHVLKRIVVPVQKTLQADVRIEFAHSYSRKIVADAR